MHTTDRAKNAAKLCCHFARNLAYYGAGRNVLRDTGEPFWLTVVGNFVDIAVLEWCKLFGNRNGKYHWRKVLTNPDAFRDDMLKQLGLSQDRFESMHLTVKTYRDEFVAHLEDADTTTVPNMNVPYILAWSYYRQLHADYPSLALINELPRDYGNYFAAQSRDAERIIRLAASGNSQ